jgi:hypothetical protein
MAIDYNHTRETLDIFASTMLCIMLKIDPNGPNARRFFVSGRIATSLTPYENGLHYGAKRGAAPIKLNVKNRCADGVVKLLGNNQWNIKLHHGHHFIPNMDLFKPDSYGFDLRQMGFHLAPFVPQLDPIDPGTHKASLCGFRELEDYCYNGDIMQWYEDMPARQERLNGLKHEFYGHYGYTRF